MSPNDKLMADPDQPWDEGVAQAASQPDQTDTGHDNPLTASPETQQTRFLVAAWRGLLRAWMTFRGDKVTPVRLASHLALLLMAVFVLALSRVELPSWEIVRMAPAQPAAAAPSQELAFEPLPIGGSPLQESGVLVRAPVPFTEIPDRPREGVITYTVQLDDTVLGIGEQFNLNPNTILWANLEDLNNPFVMEVGQILLIPPIDGVLHTVKEGDTVDKIAKLYKATTEAIVGYAPNQLTSAEDPLTVGAVLIVPDGDRTPPEQMVAAPSARGGTGTSAPWRAAGFVWPSYGRLTQRFWLACPPGHRHRRADGHTGGGGRRGHGDHRRLELGGLWQSDSDPPPRRLRDALRPPEQHRRQLWRLRRAWPAHRQRRLHRTFHRPAPALRDSNRRPLLQPTGLPALTRSRFRACQNEKPVVHAMSIGNRLFLYRVARSETGHS